MNRTQRNPHVVGATLPASSAYTNQAPFKIPDGCTGVTFYVTYTRAPGVGTCRPKFQIWIGNGAEEGPLVTVDPTVAAAQPFGRTSLYLGEILGPIPSTDTAITFALPVVVRGGESTIRLLAAEYGAAGTPGTCAIALTGGR